MKSSNVKTKGDGTTNTAQINVDDKATATGVVIPCDVRDHDT